MPEDMDDALNAALNELTGGSLDEPAEGAAEPTEDEMQEEILAIDAIDEPEEPTDTEGDGEGNGTGEGDEDAETSDDDSSKKSKKKKRGKKGKEVDMQKFRRIGLFACMILIVGVCGALGFWLIDRASFLGILVIIAGIVAAFWLLITNMNRLKVYEDMTDKIKNSEKKGKVKLDEDMEKCQGRIAALDARAADFERDNRGGPEG